MTISLYELSGIEDERCFSPYVWRARLALAHKGLEVEGIPVRFTEKEKIAFAGSTTLPVLVDDGHTVADSWLIGCYLEDTYGDRPSLFGGTEGRAFALFVNEWSGQVHGFRRDDPTSGQSGDVLKPEAQQAWAELARAIFNLKEFIYLK